jgi:hypothetical protein
VRSWRFLIRNSSAYERKDKRTCAQDRVTESVIQDTVSTRQGKRIFHCDVEKVFHSETLRRVADSKTGKRDSVANSKTCSVVPLSSCLLRTVRYVFALQFTGKRDSPGNLGTGTVELLHENVDR